MEYHQSQWKRQLVGTTHVLRNDYQRRDRENHNRNNSRKWKTTNVRHSGNFGVETKTTATQTIIFLFFLFYYNGVKNEMENYKGINFEWDEDNDERIYEAIEILLEKLPAWVWSGIKYVQEHEGSLIFWFTEDMEGGFSLNYLKENNAEIHIEKSGNDWWSYYFANEDKIKCPAEYINEYDRKRIEEEFEIPPRIISTQTRYEVCKRQKWKCNICGEQLKFHRSSEWKGELCHIDHIHPYSEATNYSRGCQNINETINLQALCEKCNLKKWKYKKVTNEKNNPA